jgi:hypothetical protein
MTPPGGELDQGGELVPFPAPRDDDQAHETESRTAPEPDDDAVPVDPPALPLSTLGPAWERPTDAGRCCPAG